MSAAQELRDAAAKEREDWGGSLDARLYPQATAIHLALADLLRMQADHALGRGSACESCVEQALIVARAINGSAS